MAAGRNPDNPKLMRVEFGKRVGAIEGGVVHNGGRGRFRRNKSQTLPKQALESTAELLGLVGRLITKYGNELSVIGGADVMV